MQEDELGCGRGDTVLLLRGEIVQAPSRERPKVSVYDVYIHQPTVDVFTILFSTSRNLTTVPMISRGSSCSMTTVWRVKRPSLRLTHE